MKKTLATIAAAGFSAILLAAAPPKTTAEPSLQQIRAATERFRDVRVALREGYVRDPMNECYTAEMMGQTRSLGAMGIHYFRPDLLGIKGPPNPRVDGDGTHIDFLKPSILIYEPEADGSLKLVAVENLVFKKAWLAAHHRRPSLYGRPYDLMADDPRTKIDEAHMFQPHFDRHIWLYRANPQGIFAQFNPRVSCRSAKNHMSMAQHH
jgi:hypothetical protein